MSVFRLLPLPAAMATSLRQRAFAGALLPVLCGAAWFPCTVLAEPTRAAATQHYDIPAGVLTESLNRFGRQANILLSFSSAQTNNLRSAALRGNYTIADAFAQLLAGSGLEAIPDGNGGYTLRALPEAVPATLPTMKISGNAFNAAVDSSDTYTVAASKSASGLALAPRDTPQAVTVVTRQQIDDRSLNSIDDVLRQTTGISVKRRDQTRNYVASRGFLVSNYQIDGVPFTSDEEAGEETGLGAASTAIYDRIEIVHGATGLVSGDGDPSATVNLVRKRASSRALTGSVDVEAGSWNHAGGTVDVSTPVSADGDVRTRVVGRYTDVDSFLDFASTKNSVLYAILDADLGASTSLSIGASYEKKERDGRTWSAVPYFFADGGETDWSRSKSLAFKGDEWDTEESTVFANLEHQLGNRWVLGANASYYEHREYLNAPSIYGDPERETGLGFAGNAYQYSGNPEQYQISVSASGPFDAFGRTHEATLRLLRYEKHRGGWYQGIYPQGDPLALDTINIYEWDGSLPSQVWGARTKMRDYETTETAFHGAARLQLTDALKVIVGGRISDWKQVEQPIAPMEDQSVYEVLGATIHYDNEFIPYLGVIYDLTDELSAYGSYTSIFKPQSLLDRFGRTLDALEGNTYELGLKGEFLDGTLQTTATVFAIRQDNYAVEDTSVPRYPDGTFPYRAASGIESDGYELEVTGALTERWDITAGWTKYDVDGPDGEQIAPEHPRKILRLFTTYKFDGNWRGLRLGGGLSWQGDQSVTHTNPGTGLDEEADEGDYTFVDLMAEYAFDKHWSVQLNAYNVFDKQHKSVDPYGGYQMDDPANVLLSGRYRF